MGEEVAGCALRGWNVFGLECGWKGGRVCLADGMDDLVGLAPNCPKEVLICADGVLAGGSWVMLGESEVERSALDDDGVVAADEKGAAAVGAGGDEDGEDAVADASPSHADFELDLPDV